MPRQEAMQHVWGLRNSSFHEGKFWAEFLQRVSRNQNWGAKRSAPGGLIYFLFFFIHSTLIRVFNPTKNQDLFFNCRFKMNIFEFQLEGFCGTSIYTCLFILLLVYLKCVSYLHLIPLKLNFLNACNQKNLEVEVYCHVLMHHFRMSSTIEPLGLQGTNDQGNQGCN